MSLDKIIKSNYSAFFKSFNAALDDQFVQRISHIVYLVLEYGDENHSEQGDTELHENHPQIKKFEGWKLAHLAISDDVVIYLKEVDSLKTEILWLHKNKRKKEKDLKRNQLKKIEFRVKLLRRLYDSIFWLLHHNDISVIRRYNFDYTIDNLSIKNVLDSQQFIDNLNKDPCGVALNSDITTFVQKGDVLYYHMARGYEVIELKTGHKGKDIYKKVLSTLKIVCEDELDDRVKDLSTKDRRQFLRYRRQMLRGISAVNILNKGQGYDFDLEREVVIREIPEKNFSEYSSSLINCFDIINSGKEWAVDIIDECLYIGLYSNSRAAFLGFSAWMDGRGCDSKIYNVLSFIDSGLMRPAPCFNLPVDMIKKILTGDLILLLCIDIPRLVEKFNASTNYSIVYFPKKSFLGTSKEMEELVSYKKYLLKVKCPDGDWFVGNGVIVRVLFDFSSPLSVLKIYSNV